MARAGRPAAGFFVSIFPRSGGGRRAQQSLRSAFCEAPSKRAAVRTSLPVRANATGRGLSSSREKTGFAPQMSRARESRAPFCRAFHQSRSSRRKSGMSPTAAYLIALALTLLILVILWEGLS
jgi:hypothetical protein